MKKLIALALTALMLLTGASALAEAEPQTQIEKALALIPRLPLETRSWLRRCSTRTTSSTTLPTGTGRDAFVASVEGLAAAPEATTVENIRAFEDGEYVFLHTVYNFAGAGEQVAFDIFRLTRTARSPSTGTIWPRWPGKIHLATRRSTARRRSPIWIRPRRIASWLKTSCTT